MSIKEYIAHFKYNDKTTNDSSPFYLIKQIDNASTKYILEYNPIWWKNNNTVFMNGKCILEFEININEVKKIIYIYEFKYNSIEHLEDIFLQLNGTEI